jgi:hypothetical protein
VRRVRFSTGVPRPMIGRCKDGDAAVARWG